jgi:hypothetical protein
VPVAPGLFSTTTGCFSSSGSLAATARAATSGGVPAAQGTTMRSGWLG